MKFLRSSIRFDPGTEEFGIYIKDADFSVTGFNVNQNLEEAMTVSVKAKPTASTRAPQWVTGSGT